MRKALLGVVVCALMAGCLAKHVQLEPAAPRGDGDAAYLTKAMATPLTFSVPVEKSEEAWSRVNSFISKYSSRKIQTASAYIIETYNPEISQFGYSANRATKGNEAEFTVACVTGPPALHLNNNFVHADKVADRNAHLLAYYAITGEVVEYLIGR